MNRSKGDEGHSRFERWLERPTARVDARRIERDVRSLPGPRNRLHSPERMREADELILGELRDAGWDANARPFAMEGVQGELDHGGPTGRSLRHTYPHLEGVNIVATKEGRRSREAITVLAHHDTVRDSPGADDNTASVAALLELARALAPHEFARTIVLACPDMEEIGLVGTRALAPELLRERPVHGVFNFETMGYYTRDPGTQHLPPGFGLLFRRAAREMRDRAFAGDFVALVHRRDSAQLARSLAAGLARSAGNVPAVLLEDPRGRRVVGPLLSRLLPPLRNLSRSDHAVFWSLGVPAVMVTDSANFRTPHYHRPTDTAEKLDYRILASVVNATADAVAEHAGFLA